MISVSRNTQSAELMTRESSHKTKSWRGQWPLAKDVFTEAIYEQDLTPDQHPQDLTFILFPHFKGLYLALGFLPPYQGMLIFQNININIA